MRALRGNAGEPLCRQILLTLNSGGSEVPEPLYQVPRCQPQPPGHADSLQDGTAALRRIGSIISAVSKDYGLRLHRAEYLGSGPENGSAGYHRAAAQPGPVTHSNGICSARQELDAAGSQRDFRSEEEHSAMLGGQEGSGVEHIVVADDARALLIHGNDGSGVKDISVAQLNSSGNQGGGRIKDLLGGTELQNFRDGEVTEFLANAVGVILLGVWHILLFFRHLA